jgi:hypothetical protein
MLKGDDSPRKPTALSKPVQKQPGYLINHSNQDLFTLIQ